MANAPIDENGRQGIICALNTNPTQGNAVAILVDPTQHYLYTTSGAGQTDNGNHGANALIDESGRHSWFGLSSTDGVTRIIVYANSSGQILTQ